MLIAGILSEISGIFVVESDRGNIFSLNFSAPLGDIKYEQKPKAFSSLCNATSSTLVFENAFLIHSSLGCFGLNMLQLASPVGEILWRMLSVLIPKKQISTFVNIARFSFMKSATFGCV